MHYRVMLHTNRGWQLAWQNGPAPATRGRRAAVAAATAIANGTKAETMVIGQSDRLTSDRLRTWVRRIIPSEDCPRNAS